MKFPEGVQVVGDKSFRGACPSEIVEQVTFFNRLRKEYPDTLGKIALHIRNEGNRTHNQAARQKAEGMVTGAPDIVIPGNPTILIEMKRRDHTLSRISLEQIEYLKAAKVNGAIVVISLGCDAAYEFVCSL